MAAHLILHEVGPAVSIQDLGRTGTIAMGLTRGGALDRLALYEGAALLGRPVQAAIEMVGLGGRFEVTHATRIALTGGDMTATCDGAPLAWNASHLLPAGSDLRIGGVTRGVVGYLHLGGAMDLPDVMGSPSSHLAAGLGPRLEPGMKIALLPDSGTNVDHILEPSPRFGGGTVRLVRTHQTHLFGEAALDRFVKTQFKRDARANRQGIRFNPEGEGFAAEGGLTVVSEIIAPGDIQVTGDGAPYVLMCESQTTGGYPRLATVLPSDLPRVAQAPLGAEVRFEVVSLDAARAIEKQARSDWAGLSARVRPRLRDPADIADLASYTLTSGVTDALADPFEGAH